MPTDITPILVGSGQYVVHDINSVKEVLSSVELAAGATLSNAGSDDLASHLDTVTTPRLFMDSAKPQRVIYGSEGGQSPQHFENTFAELIHAGESKTVLICGAKATATMRTAPPNQWEMDWTEDLEGDVPPQVYALLENA